MKTFGWIMLLLTMVTATLAQQKENRSSDSWTVIRAGTVIDGKSDKPSHDQVVIIHGNRIESDWQCGHHYKSRQVRTYD